MVLSLIWFPLAPVWKIWMSFVPLNEIVLAVPAAVPPTAVFGAPSILRPAWLLPSAAVPAEFVPSRLLWTIFPAALLVSSTADGSPPPHGVLISVLPQMASPANPRLP